MVTYLPNGRCVKVPKDRWPLSELMGTLVSSLMACHFIASHLNRFSLEALKNVQFIETDMNDPYFELIKRCFPNAKVVVDRFHIVQQLNRSFNQLRIGIMKSLNHNGPVQIRHYRQLKSLYTLLLKRTAFLDYTTTAIG